MSLCIWPAHFWFQRCWVAAGEACALWQYSCGVNTEPVCCAAKRHLYQPPGAGAELARGIGKAADTLLKALQFLHQDDLMIKTWHSAGLV